MEFRDIRASLRRHWPVALLVLAVAITANFAGLYELPSLSFTRAGGRSSAFATGLLAAFVATPCTGPFMAAALGAALLLPWWQALTLFATLSVGVMERDVHIERFRSDGTRLAMALQNHIDMAVRDLEILQRMFYKSEVEPAEFRAVSSPMLVRSPWQKHFAYLP